jgi:hypothetical protein
VICQKCRKPWPRTWEPGEWCSACAYLDDQLAINEMDRKARGEDPDPLPDVPGQTLIPGCAPAPSSSPPRPAKKPKGAPVPSLFGGANR